MALESPPEKKFEDQCVRQLGPGEAVGRNGLFWALGIVLIVPFSPGLP